MILGGGPNRIGQGIEFDYCCVHAAFALKEDGFETLMVNSNPETVSTDYDTSDKLYFEPLTLEDVLHIYEREKCWGAIAQFGGQTPLNLALGLQKNGVNIIGTSPQSIEIAEDRKLFAAMLRQAATSPSRPTASPPTKPRRSRPRADLGYPVLVRPCFVLGGRAMQIVYSDAELQHYMRFAVEASPERPVLVDKFLEDATEVDVDCIADVGHFADPDEGTIVIGGILEHIEFAGVHSGDAAMVLPPHTLSEQVIETIREYTHAMARELKVIGLMNVQYAVKGDTVYVLEVNPRASRTVPFVSKAIGVPLAKLAARVMAGKKLNRTWVHQGNLAAVLGGQGIRLPLQPLPRPGHPALARNAFHRRSHGPGRRPGHRLRQIADGRRRPAAHERARLHQRQRRAQRRGRGGGAEQFAELGFELVATSGTAAVLEKAGLKVRRIFKLAEGRPNTLDLLKNREIQLVINTPAGQTPRADGVKIRTTAVYTGTPHHDHPERRQSRRPGHRRPQEERLRRQDPPGISLITAGLASSRARVSLMVFSSRHGEFSARFSPHDSA